MDCKFGQNLKKLKMFSSKRNSYLYPRMMMVLREFEVDDGCVYCHPLSGRQLLNWLNSVL